MLAAAAALLAWRLAVERRQPPPPPRRSSSDSPHPKARCSVPATSRSTPRSRPGPKRWSSSRPRMAAAQLWRRALASDRAEPVAGTDGARQPGLDPRAARGLVLRRRCLEAYRFRRRGSPTLPPSRMPPARHGGRTGRFWWATREGRSSGGEPVRRLRPHASSPATSDTGFLPAWTPSAGCIWPNAATAGASCASSLTEPSTTSPEPTATRSQRRVGCSTRAAAPCSRSGSAATVPWRAGRTRWSWVWACRPRAAPMPPCRRGSRSSRLPAASSIACSGSTPTAVLARLPASRGTTGRYGCRPTIARPRSRCSNRCCARWTSTSSAAARGRRCRSRWGSPPTPTRCGRPTGDGCCSARCATGRRGSSHARSAPPAQRKSRCWQRRPTRPTAISCRRSGRRAGEILFAAIAGSRPDTDIFRIPAKPRQPAPALATGFNESDARLSPDGRWVAYVSDESGQPDVYVSGWPQGPRARVSQAGGLRPRWAGASLYFLRREEVLRANRRPGAAPTFDVPQRVFTLPGIRDFDVSHAGARLLVVGPAARPVSRRSARSWTGHRRWPCSRRTDDEPRTLLTLG